MPRSGGTYTPPSSSWSPAVDTQNAISADFNGLLNDLASALTTSIATDGSSAITANIPLAGHKLTGLAAGSGNGDSVRYEQLVGAYQPVAANLTALAALTFSATTYIKLTGASAASVVAPSTIATDIGLTGGYLLISGGTLTNALNIIDANYTLNLSAGVATLSFDSTDFISYTRSNNTYNFNIGGSSVLTVGAAAISPVPDVVLNGTLSPTSAFSAGYRGLGSTPAKTVDYTYVAKDAGTAIDFSGSTNKTFKLVTGVLGGGGTRYDFLTGANIGTASLFLASDSGVTFINSAGATVTSVTVAPFQQYSIRAIATSETFLVRVF